MILYSFDNFLLSLKALIFYASILIYKHYLFFCIFFEYPAFVFKKKQFVIHLLKFIFLNSQKLYFYINKMLLELKILKI